MNTYEIKITYEGGVVLIFDKKIRIHLSAPEARKIGLDLDHAAGHAVLQKIYHHYENRETK